MEKNRDQNKVGDYRWLPEFLKAFVEMSSWIAIPVIGALFLGQWLDNKYQTGNTYFFSLTAAAFIFSCLGLGKTAMKYLRRAENSKKELSKEKDLKQNGDRSGD